MGRHRRSAPHDPERPRTGQVDGPTGAVAPAGHRGHRAARRSAPVRTGLLGASAAVAMGAVAVASGLVPGGGRFVASDDGAGRVRAGALPDAQPQESFSAPVNGPSDVAGRDGGGVRSGGTGGSGGDDGNAASRGAGRTGSPTSPASPGASPSASRPVATPTRVPGGRPSASPTGGTATATPRPSVSPTAAPVTGGGTEAAAEAEVVSLVNQARAEAGCAPVTAGDELTGLAERFSDDMARRGFFGHTDPDGHTPWDRARAQGIANLGGENLARGQADAHSVMDSWMNSPGHRANILNCEYKSLGVGAHFGPGGPWWAQEFGF
ncbi:CAP domain-containing protein [Streptomyces sp. MspMP-M5]|uniref:CAP domain-containing protein n=1 Tax=Streptomyces sp. MspMP-M5 TaxID=1155718 RepID=UPI0004764E86|nr:CAP domain-containing protein [Streptomyces sp. SID8354]